MFSFQLIVHYPHVFLNVYLFILFSAVLGLSYCTSLSLVVESRGYFLIAMRLLIAVASLVAELGLQGARTSVAVAPGLEDTGAVVGHTDLVVLKHLGSSQIKDQTHVSCIGRWIVYQGSPLEVFILIYLLFP